MRYGTAAPPVGRRNLSSRSYIVSDRENQCSAALRGHSSHGRLAFPEMCPLREFVRDFVIIDTYIRGL